MAESSEPSQSPQVMAEGLLPLLLETHTALTAEAAKATAKEGAEAGSVYTKPAQEIRSTLSVLNEVAANTSMPEGDATTLQNTYGIYSKKEQKFANVVQIGQDIQNTINLLKGANDSLVARLEPYVTMLTEHATDKVEAERRGLLFYTDAYYGQSLYVTKEAKAMMNEIATNSGIAPVKLPAPTKAEGLAGAASTAITPG